MADWQRVADVRGFLAQKGTRRERDHAFTKRVAHWAYCKQCGLVLLRNDISRRAAAGKCITHE